MNAVPTFLFFDPACCSCLVVRLKSEEEEEEQEEASPESPMRLELTSVRED